MQEDLTKLIIPDFPPIMDPSKKIESDEENSELFSEGYPFRLPLRIKSFENEAEFIKFSKNCEKLLRGSLEYKLWRSYILDVLQENICVVTQERIDQISIEIHHHIPSLFTLMKVLINKRIEAEESFSTFDICQDAIKLHFDNKVGYLVLITSMHEKLHNGHLNVPMRLVRGDYTFFVSNYSKYLDESELEAINRRLVIEDCDPSWSVNNYPGLKVIGDN